MKLIFQAYSPQLINDRFAALGRAVIRQASYEYRMLHRKLRSCKDPEKADRLADDIMSIRDFFLSDWFVTLSGVDEDKVNGQEVLQRLDAEVLENR